MKTIRFTAPTFEEALAKAVKEIMNNEARFKEIHIAARIGKEQRQKADINTIIRLTKEIKTADTREAVMAQSGIACGYINAMNAHDLISDEEMQQLINMIGEVGEIRLHEVSKIEFKIFSRYFRKKVAM